MQIPTNEQMDEILNTGLSEDYPDDCVELGEGWQLIAAISRYLAVIGMFGQRCFTRGWQQGAIV